MRSKVRAFLLSAMFVGGISSAHADSDYHSNPGFIFLGFDGKDHKFGDVPLTTNILGVDQNQNRVIELNGATAPDNDVFSGFETSLYGGSHISNMTFTYATDVAQNTSATVKISSEPYGAYDSGAGLSLFTSGGPVTSLRAGVSGGDYRIGPSIQTAIGGFDMVGFYEDISNSKARLVVPNVTYDTKHVYMPGCNPTTPGTCVPLSVGDMARIHQGMYIVTNSVDPKNATQVSANGSMTGPHLYAGFVDAVDPAGKFITVNSWAVLGGTDTSDGQVPSTTYESYWSSRTVPTVFIGSPTKSFGRNLFIHYNEADSIGENVSNVHGYSGEELDIRGTVTKSRSLNMTGIVISGYLDDQTPNGDGLTRESAGIFVGGPFPVLFAGDPGAHHAVFNTGNAYIGAPAEDWDVNDSDTATLGGYTVYNEFNMIGNYVNTGVESSLWHVRSTKASGTVKTSDRKSDDDIYMGTISRPGYRDSDGVYQIGRKDTVWGWGGQVSYGSGSDWAIALCGTTPSPANTSNFTTNNQTCGVKVSSNGDTTIQNLISPNANLGEIRSDNALLLSAASAPDGASADTFNVGGQGAMVMWNYVSVGRGSTEFINVNPGTVGGFFFYDIHTSNPIKNDNNILFSSSRNYGFVINTDAHVKSTLYSPNVQTNSLAPSTQGNPISINSGIVFNKPVTYANLPASPTIQETEYCTDCHSILRSGSYNVTGVLVVWNGTGWTDLVGNPILH